MTEALRPAAGTEYAKIGGWLILPAIGTVLAPLWTLKEVVQLLAAIFSPNWGRTAPGIQNLIVGEVVVNVLIAAAWLFTAFLLFKLKRLFPAAFIAMCALSLVATFFDIIIANSIVGIRWESQDSTTILKPLLYAAIWIPYMVFSRRVKNTFIN
jgi:hypothetical protein